jgi:hypothetical protein
MSVGLYVLHTRYPSAAAHPCCHDERLSRVYERLSRVHEAHLRPGASTHRTWGARAARHARGTSTCAAPALRGAGQDLLGSQGQGRIRADRQEPEPHHLRRVCVSVCGWLPCWFAPTAVPAARPAGGGSHALCCGCDVGVGVDFDCDRVCLTLTAVVPGQAGRAGPAPGGLRVPPDTRDRGVHLPLHLTRVHAGQWVLCVVGRGCDLQHTRSGGGQGMLQ